MKVVADTNLFIQGLIFRGDARQILNLAYCKKIDLYGSSGSYNELKRVVGYPHLKRYLEKEIYTPEKLLISYKSLINFVTIDDRYEDLHVVNEDADDDEFVRIAKTINSKFIVSSDKHLRKLKKYEEIRIVEPDIFLKIYPSLIGRKFT